MNLLIETQAFIYWAMRPEELPARALDAIRSPDNTVYLSVVSAWEMQIKYNLKKRELRQRPGPLVQSELDTGAFKLLSLTLRHIDALSHLPNHHRDPFDRSLIALATDESLIIVTGDEKIAMYSLETIWQ